LLQSSGIGASTDTASAGCVGPAGSDEVPSPLGIDVGAVGVETGGAVVKAPSFGTDGEHPATMTITTVTDAPQPQALRTRTPHPSSSNTNLSKNDRPAPRAGAATVRAAHPGTRFGDRPAPTRRSGPPRGAIS